MPTGAAACCKTAMLIRLLLLCASLAAFPAQASYLEHPRAPQLIQELEELGVPAAYTRPLLQSAQLRPELIAAERNSAEKTKTWPEYLSIFLQPKRIQGGLAFWSAQQHWLEQAHSRYGIPPEVIVAIIGVETLYGGYTGPHRILDSLATQGLDHPTRQPFFYNELKEFIRLCHERGFDGLELKGSYAGAMGLSQFMPSNYRRLAVDFDEDGKIDLWNPADAIGSTAHYLTAYRGPGKGWQPDMPVLVAAVGQADADWPRNPKQPSHSYGQMSAQLTAIPGIPSTAPVGLIELDNVPGVERWFGLQNFYNLMAYNPRVYYAMAVYRLSRAIADQQQR